MKGPPMNITLNDVLLAAILAVLLVALLADNWGVG